MNVESIRNNRRAFLEQLSLHFLINQTHKRALTRTHTGNTDDSMRYFKSKGLMFDIYVRRDKNGTTQIPINGRGKRGRPSKSDQNTREGVARQSTPPPLAPHKNMAMCLLFVGSIIGEETPFL